MGISAHYWMIAFVFALALHALAGGAIWIAHNAAPAPQPAPRGVMVSLDALSVGNSTQISSETPAPIQPVQAAAPEPVPAQAAQPTAADSVAPTPISTAEPTAVAPVAAGATPATAEGVEASANGVDIPVAHAVTIKAADTLAALEHATASPAPIATAAPAEINTGSGAQGQSMDPTTTYIDRITLWLGNHKYYPQTARSSGAEGTVRLHIVIGRDGRVINVGIAHSSGSSALDQAAMDMVKRSEPLPAMTDNMLRTRLEIILPVHYTLSVAPDAVVATPE